MSKKVVYKDSDWWEYQLRVVKAAGEECHCLEEVGFLICELEIAPGQRILDLGCGSGRHIRLLADRCWDCYFTGLDISPLLIEHSKSLTAGSNNETYAEGNMLHVGSYTEKYNAVLMLGATFGLLSHENNEQVLWNVHRALKPGGKLVLQQHDPGHYICKVGTGKLYRAVMPEGTYTVRAGYSSILRQGIGVFQLETTDTIYKRQYPETFMLYTLKEIKKMLIAVGLTPLTAYGNIYLEAYEPGASTEMIIVAQKE